MTTTRRQFITAFAAAPVAASAQQAASAPAPTNAFHRVFAAGNYSFFGGADAQDPLGFLRKGNLGNLGFTPQEPPVVNGTQAQITLFTRPLNTRLGSFSGILNGDFTQNSPTDITGRFSDSQRPLVIGQYKTPDGNTEAGVLYNYRGDGKSLLQTGVSHTLKSTMGIPDGAILTFRLRRSNIFPNEVGGFADIPVSVNTRVTGGFVTRGKEEKEHIVVIGFKGTPTQQTKAGITSYLHTKFGTQIIADIEYSLPRGMKIESFAGGDKRGPIGRAQYVVSLPKSKCELVVGGGWSRNFIGLGGISANAGMRCGF